LINILPDNDGAAGRLSAVTEKKRQPALKPHSEQQTPFLRRNPAHAVSQSMGRRLFIPNPQKRRN
jgi:hypothetical protein